MAAFQQAVQRYPNNAAILKLGNTIYAVGRSEDAVPHLKELALALAKGWQ